MRAKQYYTLINSNGRDVQIDLANYKTRCTITGEQKQFYHKYLFNLIHRKYQGNIDVFRTTYVSRAGTPRKTQAERLDDQIERARARLSELLAKQTRLQTLSVSE
jgi:hypothetical protein